MSELNGTGTGGEPTVDQMVAAFAVPLIAALAREKRNGLRKIVQLADGRQLCITVSRRRRAKVKPVRNVPDEVARLTDAFQRVYIALRACRATNGPTEEVNGPMVWKMVAEQPEDELALETVYKALKRLIVINEVRKDQFGYHIGSGTVPLAFSDSHSELAVRRAQEGVESIPVN